MSCLAAACGDAVSDTGESCDDGASNSNADPTHCRLDCDLEYTCGDAGFARLHAAGEIPPGRPGDVVYAEL